MLRRLLFDENFNHRIVHGLQLRLAELDFVIAQEIELKGAQSSSSLHGSTICGRGGHFYSHLVLHSREKEHHDV